MKTSSNSLQEDKANEVSVKSTMETAAKVHLFCDSDRQGHNDYVHIPLTVSLKSKEPVDEFIAFPTHEVEKPLSSPIWFAQTSVKSIYQLNQKK